MTVLDRQAARERCDAATPGPWDTDVPQEGGAELLAGSAYPTYRLAVFEFPDDARFSGHARTDLPAALDLLDEKDREIARLRATLGEQRHIVDVTATQFGLQHPVECRPDLLACPVRIALNALDGPPMPVGRYVVTLDDDGLHYDDLVGES